MSSKSVRTVDPTFHCREPKNRCPFGLKKKQEDVEAEEDASTKAASGSNLKSSGKVSHSSSSKSKDSTPEESASPSSKRKASKSKDDTHSSSSAAPVSGKTKSLSNSSKSHNKPKEALEERGEEGEENSDEEGEFDEEFGEEDDEEVEEEASSSTNNTSSSLKDVPSSGKKKLTWLQKKKKGLASKTAGSSIGRSLFNKYVDKDTKSLISNVCSIIKQEDGSKQATKVKSDILKSAAKILILYHEKQLTEDHFQTLIFSFRRICSAIRNAYQAKNLTEATANRVHSNAVTFYEQLGIALDGLITEKNLVIIKSLIDYIFSPKLLVASAKYHAEFQIIAFVLASYLQVGK